MPTIGQQLKAAREEQRITLDMAFEATRIRMSYLRALEDDDHSSLPSPVQARGYLRNYAEYLGLNIDTILEELRNSEETFADIIGPADLTSSPAESTLEVNSSQSETLLSPPQVDSVSATDSPLEVEIAEPEFTDNLWQTWLNRLSSVIPLGNKRTQAQEASIPEVTQTEIEEEIAEPVAPENLQPSDEIFKEIGAQLRERRESLSLNLNEVERNTHVKAHYLEALEQGAFHKLPSTVQTRGMLSNYTSFLDMDVDAILLRFADALQARHKERNPGQPARKPNQPIIPVNLSVRNFIAGDMVFGIGIAVLLVGFSIWGINYVVTLQNQREFQPTAPSISDVLLATLDPSQITPSPTLVPVEEFIQEATPTIIIPTVNVNVNVQLNIVAVERAYMRVIADGKVVFEGRTIPGNAYLFEGEEQVEVLVGSGAAIRVVYNGRDLGLMGGFGQIISNIYRAEEIVTPTPLATPTITETAEPTLTPVPSSTPSN